MRIRFSALLTAASLLASCDGDDGGGAETSLGPPSLEIDRLQPAGGESPDGASLCIEPGKDAAGTILVVLKTTRDGRLTNWTLASFDACGSLTQCGVVLLTVERSSDGTVVYSVAAAATAIPVPIKEIAELRPEESYTFRVELRDQFGEVVPDAGVGYSDSEPGVEICQFGDAGVVDGSPGDAEAGLDAGPTPDASDADGGHDAGDAGDAAPDGTTDAAMQPDSSVAADAADDVTGE